MDKYETLRHCAEVFREYERLHRIKETPEGDQKADRNAQMALLCESATDWRPIGEYQPDHDPQKIIGWASLQVWPYCHSPEFVRPPAYWTEWKDWTFYHDGMKWKCGTESIDCKVLKVRISHWTPRLSAPVDFDETVYQEAYHN